MRSLLSIALLLLIWMKPPPTQAADSAAGRDMRIDANGYSESRTFNESVACRQATDRARHYLRGALRLALEEHLVTAADVDIPRPISTSRSWDAGKGVCTVTYSVVISKSATVVRPIAVELPS